jgi:hypothetical protein
MLDLDIFRVAKAILVQLVTLGQPLKAVLLQPLMTVGMLLFLYAGWHVRDEGSIDAGLQVAFVDTKAYRLQHLRDLESAILQGELRRSAITDQLVGQLMTALLQRAPRAARVRLGVVHNGITGLTGIALLRVDITNAVAAPGRTVGPLSVNQPLSDWSGFLPTLLAGKCDFHLTQQESSVVIRSRLTAMGAGSFMSCPVIDVQGRMLGAISVTWDEHDSAPGGAELQSLMDFAGSICIQIAAALDLRGHVPALFTGDPVF